MENPVAACHGFYSRWRLQGYVARLPEGIQSNPQQLGSLSYSCVTRAHEEERMLHEAVPKSPFQVSKLVAFPTQL